MATLDINDVLPQRDYTALTAQTVFTVPFEFFADADLVVRVDGALMALNVDYTVTGAEVEGGGTVAFGTPMSGGEAVRIYTDIAAARDVKYVQSGSLSHEVLERDFATAVRRDQQYERDLTRSLHLNVTDPTVDMELVVAASRAGKYLKFGTAGEPLMAAALAGTETIDADSVGQALWPRTAEEISVGITPTYYYYAPGDVRRYGASDGGAAATNQTALERALSVGAAHEVYIPAGTYAHTDQLDITIDGTSIRGDGYNSVLALTGTFTGVNAYSLGVPADGDNFGGTADGAQNVSIDMLRLDGSAAAESGIRVFGCVLNYGKDHRIGTLWTHNFDKAGFGIYGQSGDVVSATVETLYSYAQDGTGGLGAFVSTDNTSESNIVFGTVIAYDNESSGNGLGFDFSQGSATVKVLKTWNNGAGGCKIAGPATQRVSIGDMDVSDNTNSGADGFYTNGTFEFLDIGTIRAHGNANHGVAINHAGRVRIGRADIADNGDTDAAGIGFYQFANSPVVQVGTLYANNNYDQGVRITSGDFQCGAIYTTGNGDEGLRIDGAGAYSVGTIISVDDCVDGAFAMAVNIQPGSNPKSVYLSHVHAADSAANVTIGVSVNANATNAHIGRITVDSVTNKISDSGTGTVFPTKLIGGSTYTTGAHGTLRDFTGTTTAAHALQLLETLVDDLKSAGTLP